MPKFFQNELAAHGGQKQSFSNVEFKKGSLDSTSAAETGTLLEIIPVHIKNPPVIQFIAYIESMSDRFSPSFQSEQPFGRPDPYYIWKSNTRVITISWAVPSSSKAMALDNLNNLSWFLASLYPTYKDTASVTSIAASPLFRVRNSNLISSPTNDGQGILCAIDGVSVNPQVKEGFISISPKNMESDDANTEAALIMGAGFENSIHEGKKLLIPKLIKLNCTLKVVHDHALGWDYNTGEWRGGLSAPGFPYNFGLERDTKDTPSPAGPEIYQDAQTPAVAAQPPKPGSPDVRETNVATATIVDDKDNPSGVGTGETNNPATP